MKKVYTISMICILFFLTGCGHSAAETQSEHIFQEDQLELVQQAVDAFQKDSQGLLPIKTKEEDTAIYEKYLIDFTKLIPKYLTEAPASAYENGGIYQYVIVDPETDPKVKLIDLRMAESVTELQVHLQTYKEKHTYPPYKEVITDGVFTLDYEELGYQEAPYAISPYTGNHLPFIINVEGKIFVDYQADLNEQLKGISANYKEGEDIRSILWEDSPFVPAFSLSYTIKDGEIIFLTNTNS